MYSAFAHYYNRWHEEEPYENMAKFVMGAANLQAGDRILEGGCGAGHLTKALAEAGLEVTAIDRSEEMLAIAKEKTMGLPVHYRCQDIATLSQETDFSCRIFCLDVLHYLNDAEEIKKVVDTSFRSLPKGGTLVFDLLNPRVLIDRSRSGAIVYTDASHFMAWETERIDRTRFAYHLHLFRKEGDCYIRENEKQTIRAYSRSRIEKLLRNAGFRQVLCTDGYRRRRADADAERFVWIAKK